MDYALIVVLILISITLASINYKLGKIMEVSETLQRVACNLQTAGIVSAMLGKSDEDRLDIFKRVLKDKDVEL